MERKIRTYKAANADYDWARRRLVKNKEPLATIVERLIKSIAKGEKTFAIYPEKKY